MHNLNRREKYHFFNTLSFLPIMLEKRSVLIELRNETSVAGRIDNADGFMNINLTEAVYIDRNGGQYPFDEFMVKNRMIRHIIIPDSIDVATEIDEYMGVIQTRKPQGVVKNLKYKRAQIRHEEILKEIAKK